MLFRLFIPLSLSFLTLLACQGGYDSCKQKLIDSHSIHKKYISIPVLKNKRLIYSLTKPKGKILKYDPFLSLYLVNDKEKFKYPFVMNEHLSLGSAMVNYKDSSEIKIIKKQIGLNNLAKVKEKILYPAIVTNSCCVLLGLVTPKGIIEKRYIKRFLSNHNVNYSDIGIRVEDSKLGIKIIAVNPFKRNGFKVGDIIILHNDKKIKDSSTLMRNILFSEIGSKHHIKILRGSKYHTINSISTKRYGGGAISDTFLEEKGYYIDRNLKFLKIKKGSNNSLRVGDKILRVNNITIKNRDDLLKNIDSFKDKVTLLISRDGFQFFVNLTI